MPYVKGLRFIDKFALLKKFDEKGCHMSLYCSSSLLFDNSAPTTKAVGSIEVT
jgi:hypothetical protein